MDVIVVGGGLMGCAVAHALAARGASVTLLERAVVGAEASAAAGGILAPRVEAHGLEPMRTYGLRSLELYEPWIRSLGVEPEHIGFDRCGVVVVREAAPDPDAERCDDVRALEPGLAAAAGWWLPEEGVLDPRLLLRAVSIAARGAGVRVRVGDTVAAVHAGAVLLADGSALRGTVVVCGGAWTSTIAGLEGVPVRPIRGQMAALEGVALRRVVFGPRGYLVPRPASAAPRVVVGATVEDVGFDKRVTAGGLRDVLDHAVRLAPRLADAELVETWAGLRPATPDDLPLIGALDGVFLASGHYRNGILLAPITAAWMAAAVLDGQAPPAAVDPGRFSAV